MTIISRHLENAAANTPLEIEFDLGNQPASDYRLLIKAKEYGRTKGPSRQYFFHHRLDLLN